tara:strand:- start:64 stop:630 length:567 start_codon:yes stop_codon:yes gene_type:complete
MLWSLETNEKELFLTFDDGPIPQVTPKVLDILDQYEAKATFFCVGENVSKHPNVFAEVKNRGHLVGNHTYNHSNGWKTSTFAYLRQYLIAQSLIDTEWFRPPYGRIKPQQLKAIKKRSMVVMWDVLSGDFDPTITIEQCVQNVVDFVQPGSIVVLHDSLKAEARILGALPIILKQLKGNGYTFNTLRK